MYVDSMVINLNDGTQISMYDEVEDFADILKERLGYDAAWVFKEIIEHQKFLVELEYHD